MARIRSPFTQPGVRCHSARAHSRDHGREIGRLEFVLETACVGRLLGVDVVHPHPAVGGEHRDERNRQKAQAPEAEHVAQV